jgi:hypothetical protein
LFEALGPDSVLRVRAMQSFLLTIYCGIADDLFEPFIDVPTNFGEGPLWVTMRRTRGEHISSASPQ